MRTLRSFAALAVAWVLVGVGLVLQTVPAVAEVPPSVATQLANVARQYESTKELRKTQARYAANRSLAPAVVSADRFNAETQMAGVVIGAIAANPANTSDVMSAAARAAPDLSSGVAQRVIQAYPSFAPQIRQSAQAVPAATFEPQQARGPPGQGAQALAQVPIPQVQEPPGAGSDEPASSGAILEISDPLEDVNRGIFWFNDFFDTWLFRPLAWTYGQLMPNFAKRSIRNVIRNANSPVVLANNLLQADFTGAANTVGRFFANTTLGVGGLFEVADEMDLPHKGADFGQTLHVWGIGAGPYLMLPIFGPNTTRSAVGTVVDSFFDPIGYFIDTIPEGVAITAGKALVARENVLEPLDDLKANSLDYYAALRSLYYQDRAKFLRGGEAAPEESIDKLFENTE